jgi:hypothetical protein
MTVSNASGQARRAYVKVDVPNDTHDQAYLRVWVSSGSGALVVDEVDNVWQETNLTWNDVPSVIASDVGTLPVSGTGWHAIPISGVDPGSTQSFRIRSTATATVSLHSQENTSGNDPELFLDDDAPPPPVQNPSATRGSTACGVVDVGYATGASDNTPSEFTTTVDGAVVDVETVSAPSGSGGYVSTLVEDSSGGEADVVVTGNGATLLSFAVDTDCVAPPQASWPPTVPISPKVVGMSASESLWDQRLSEVGRCGVEARRIFVPDAASNWNGKFQTIQETVEDGMTPVISVKSPVSGFIAGNNDALYQNIRDDLLTLDAPVTMTFWHEPHGDMSAADFRTASQRFFDIMDAPEIAVGPILNGWLLDNQTSTFAGYTSAALLDDWEFMGVDSYHSSPGSNKLPGRAVPLVETWLDGQGHGDMPIVLGEYNGFDADAIEYGGEQILSIPEAWIGLVWNSTGGTYTPLTGDRITAYQNTKADPRAKQEEGC